MSEQFLVRNHCIAIRNELHFDKMHGILHDTFLKLHFYKCTQTDKIPPTGNDSITIQYRYAVDTSINKARFMHTFVWCFFPNACLL